MLFSGGAIPKGKVGFGCLVLLASVSTAGIVELELNKQFLSNCGKSIGEWFQRVSDAVSSSGSSPSTGKAATFEDVSYPFTYIWGQIYNPVSQAWPYVTSGVLGIKSSFSELWSAFKDLLKNIWKTETIKDIFRDLHLKIWRVLTFIFDGSGGGRDIFVALFSEEKREATKIATKFLLGMQQEGGENFKADKQVLSYLLLNWMLKPKKVTEKFEKLSKTIKNLVNKLKNGASVPSLPSGGQNHVYTLTVDTVKQYLEVEDGLPETIFNLMWMGEVASKIKTGEDWTLGTKSWISSFFRSSS